MYQAGAGGVAGGVVVGRLTALDCLGLRNLIRLCLSLGNVCLCMGIIASAI